MKKEMNAADAASYIGNWTFQKEHHESLTYFPLFLSQCS